MVGFVNYKKGCTRLTATSDKVYQLLVHDRWFSSVTPASSTTKTGHHDIAEILLKVVFNTINQIKSNQKIYFGQSLIVSTLVVLWLACSPRVDRGSGSCKLVLSAS
jgi:hypothetical protein